MSLKNYCRNIVNNFFFNPIGLRLETVNSLNNYSYNQDGLLVMHPCDFMNDPKFNAAYNRGIQAAGEDYRFHWRVYVALWVATHACKLPGVFVECGVYHGFLSSAIMHYLSWNSLEKHFFLFDTFYGLDESLVSKEEKELKRIERTQHYKNLNLYEEVCKNFEEFNNVNIIKGSIPSTLSSTQIKEVCYLSLDMNCAAPEVAALAFFWPKLVPGAMVLLDDYNFRGYEPQKIAMNKLAKELGIEILSLPTGQGLIIK